MSRDHIMPVDAAARKAAPMARGLLDYFPDALAYVAEVSRAGNDQHNPGQPIHWARGKSTDHADCIMRHLVDRGRLDPADGIRHSGKVAWRALALLQTELELAQGYDAEKEALEAEAKKPVNGATVLERLGFATTIAPRGWGEGEP